jgi:adenylate cyclase
MDNILKEDYLHSLPPGLFWLCFSLAVWASLLLLHGRSLTLCLLVPAALLAIYVAGAFLLFEKQSLQLELVAPCLALVSVHIGNIAQLVLQERQKRQELRRTFSAYVSAGVIDAIYRNQSSLQLGGAQKEVAVLFTDIRGFTSMTESMESQELVAQLNQYFTHMVEGINRHHGSLHKFIGDAIMAVWGDISYSGPAVDAGEALRAGLFLSRESARLNRLWQSEGKPVFRTGIGINHGKVILGNIGAPQRMEFTVIGDAVNLASRLEGLTKRFGCPLITGESVYELCFERFAFRPLGKIRATGKQHPVQVYQPLYELGREEESPFAASWLKLYQEAFNRFSERRYDLAIRLFEACLQEYPNDATSRLILETARELQENPPPASWDGAFEFEGK